MISLMFEPRLPITTPALFAGQSYVNHTKVINTYYFEQYATLRTIVAVMMMPPLLLDPPLLACADTGEELTLTFFFSGGSSDGDCISSRSRSRFSVDTLVDTDMVGTPPL
jgi:hypothetical protein